jgi:EmrB/QacA subfamily drug resistance transporter
MNGKARAAVVAVGIGSFMSSLDSSAVNLALPMIQNEFAASLSMVEWIVTTYLLVISSLLLTFGRLSDLYGHKKMYTVGFAVFTIGSLLCGLSVNIATLIASRAFQAVGAGMLYSAGPAIITSAVPPENRGKGLSVVAVAVALGLCVGPVVGGTLATLFGWKSIFLINLPVGIIGIFMVLKNIAQDGESKRLPFDILGSVLVFAALLAILLPLDISGDHAIPPALFIGSIAAGLLLIAAFVLVERKRVHPMLNLGLFRNRVFSASNLAALLIYMAQFVMVFLAPFYLQKFRGFSVMASGMLYLPMPLATMCVAPLSGAASDRFDSRYISSLGALIMAAGLYMLSFLGANSSQAYIVAAMVATGGGFGLFQTPNNSAIMGNVPRENRGTASGTLATMRNIGMVMGVAVSGALFSLFEDKAAAAGLPADGAFPYALHNTFLVAAGIALLSMTASLFKGRTRPAEAPAPAKE